MILLKLHHNINLAARKVAVENWYYFDFSRFKSVITDQVKFNTTPFKNGVIILLLFYLMKWFTEAMIHDSLLTQKASPRT